MLVQENLIHASKEEGFNCMYRQKKQIQTSFINLSMQAQAKIFLCACLLKN